MKSIQMIKVYELRVKETNEVLAITTTSGNARKEALNSGYEMDEIYVQENFMPQEEWNNAMINAINAI